MFSSSFAYEFWKYFDIILLQFIFRLFYFYRYLFYFVSLLFQVNFLCVIILLKHNFQLKSDNLALKMVNTPEEIANLRKIAWQQKKTENLQ